MFASLLRSYAAPMPDPYNIEIEGIGPIWISGYGPAWSERGIITLWAPAFLAWTTPRAEGGLQAQTFSHPLLPGPTAAGP